MYKQLVPLFLLLYFFTTVSSHSMVQNDDAIDEVEVSEEIIEEEEEEYKNPRESLQYDTNPVQKNPIDQNSIRDFQNDDDFNYKEELPEDNWWTRFKQKLSDLYNKFFDWLLGGRQAQGFWAFVVEVLPYILMVGLVVLIVWIFFKMDSGNLLMEKIKAPETLLSDDEALIQRPDLQGLIDQALANKNYRLAIRFYYIMLLQQMSGKDLIDWQVQKTNHEYIYEISDKILRKHFMKVTDIYDYIWYGNFDVDEDAFAKAESSFKTLNDKL